ncbi:MAG: amidase family protein [Erysipelotrichaceae bacterium]|nr:amidase family protein [Erysipelotrichaceae bacterium]
MGFKEYFKLDENQRCLDSYQKCVKYQDKLNASITLVDPSAALEGVSKGKLFKLPYALKDNVSTKGILTTAGSKILDNYLPVYDATIYQKLNKAGAVLVSKASMDELAMGGNNKSSYIGPCLNPYDLKRISGGSSGGSAVLVASGAVPFAIGSDTGDSVRKPASFCGVVGVKPTYGRISRYGVIPYANSLDHVGYFTTNVEDAALLLEVLAGRDDRDITSADLPVLEYCKLLTGDVRGKKILIFDTVLEAMKKHPQTIELFNKIIAGLEGKGAIIKHMSLDKNLAKAIFPTYYVIANCEASANHANLDGLRFGHTVDGETMEDIVINTRTRGFDSLIKKRFLVGAYSLNDQNQELIYRKAQKVRRLIVEAYNKELNEADCVLAPCSASGALKLSEQVNDVLSDEYLIGENYMAIANFAGLPSMSVPMGYLNELPIGINITAKAFDEVGMFDIAQAIEDITGLKDRVKEDF